MTSNEPTTILEARPVAQVIAEYHSLHRKNLLLSVQHTTPVSHACSRLTPNNNHTHIHTLHTRTHAHSHTHSHLTPNTLLDHTRSHSQTHSSCTASSASSRATSAGSGLMQPSSMVAVAWPARRAGPNLASTRVHAGWEAQGKGGGDGEGSSPWKTVQSGRSDS